jgi:hypothetical protein
MICTIKRPVVSLAGAARRTDELERRFLVQERQGD